MEKGPEKRGTRLSQSEIWEWQRAYFEKAGVKAWSEKVVPDFITNCAFTARAFADVVRAFLADFAAADPGGDEPVVLLEPGAGSGRFAWRFLHFLHADPLPRPVLYILSDISPDTIAFWKKNEKLKAHFREGRLDVAEFDAVKDREITLQVSGRRIEAGALAAPLLVIGNYFFDSLPHDLFRLREGALEEVRVVLNGSPADDGRLDGISFSHFFNPAQEPYYTEPAFDAVLDIYRQQADRDATFSFPLEGMRALDNLAGFSRNGCFMLAADKGPNLFDSLTTGRHLDLSRHGAVAVSVNFHALAQYVRNAGGAVLEQAHPYRRINVLGFRAGGADLPLPETLHAFTRHVGDFGPDDFNNLLEGYREAGGAALPVLFSLLRMAEWDPEVVRLFFHQLAAGLPEAGALVADRFSAGFERSALLHFPIGEEADTSMMLGGLQLVCRQPRRALRMFVDSTKEKGMNALAAWYIANCLIELQEPRDAAKWLERAELLGMEAEKVAALRARLE